MNLRLPVPTPQVPRDRGRQARSGGQETSFRNDTQRLAAAKLYPGGIQRDPSSPTLLRVSQISLNGRGQGRASPSPHHPDRHFLPRQLTGLAFRGSCQAPAAGQKSPITLAFVERQAGSNSRKACKSKQSCPPGCGLTGRRYVLSSRPTPCWPWGAEPRERGPALGATDQGAELAASTALGAVSPGDHLSVTHPLRLHPLFLDGRGPACFCVQGCGRHRKGGGGQRGLDQAARPAQQR